MNNEGSANWLRHDNVVADNFKHDTPSGFYVTVKMPKNAEWIWCSRPLGVEYGEKGTKGGPPSARVAYMGSAKGNSIQRLWKVPSKPASVSLRTRAPVPYRDDPASGKGSGQTFPPHMHCIDKEKKIFTLPYLVPECDFYTAMEIARNSKKTRWGVVFVLPRIASFGAEPLPNTIELTSAPAIAKRFAKSVPLLLYCAKETCTASKRMALSLLKEHGFELVCKYAGGMKDLEARQKATIR